MKKTLSVLISILVLSASSFAAEVSTISRTDITGQFLGVDVGARAAGMGNAVAALSSGAEAIFSNPANTVQKKNTSSLFFSHNSWLSDMSVETLGYARGIEGIGTFGLGVSYVNEGTIDSYTAVNDGNTPVSNGTIKPYALAAKLNWSNQFIKGVFGGINLDCATERIGDSKNDMLAVDLGMKYMPAELGGLSFGLAARNIGANLSGYTLYRDMLIGLGYQKYLDKKNMISLAADYGLVYDGHFKISNQSDASVGAEYVYAGMYKLRVGYQLDQTGADGLKGLRGGLGLRYGMFSFDYAIEPYGDAGTANKVSVGLNF